MKDLRKALEQGEKLMGPFAVAASPTLVECIGYAGFDFVLIDAEHCAASPVGTELEGLVRAAYAADIAPVVRVTRNDFSQILKAANFGAKGIVVPHVNTAEEAALAVQALRFAPTGRRSSAPVVRAAKHGWIPWPEFIRQENPLLFVIVEERTAMENVKEIASVPGIDVLFFGPFDLAVSLGSGENAYELLQESDGVMDEYRRKTLEAARANGLWAADLAWNAESAKRYFDMGFDFLAVGTDLSLFNSALKGLTDSMPWIKG